MAGKKNGTVDFLQDYIGRRIITYHCIMHQQDDRCLHVTLPVAAFLEMSTQPVSSRDSATRAGCAQRGLGRKTPCSRRGNISAAEDDPRPSILQLNTEVLTDRKQDQHYRAAILQEQGIHHYPTGNPLHNVRQAWDSQFLTTLVNPEQESRPCHVCSRAVGIVTGRSLSRAIRDW